MQALAMAQAADVLFGQADRKVGRFVVVPAAENFSSVVYPGQGLAVRERNIETLDAGCAFKPAIDQLEQSIASLAGYRRQSDALRIAQLLITEACVRRRLEQIDLVHRFNEPSLDGLIEAQLTQDIQHITTLRLAVRVMRVADVNDHVGFCDLFERSPEGGDEMGRKIGDKADGVRQDCLASRRQFEAPHGRVESCEQHVPGDDR